MNNNYVNSDSDNRLIWLDTGNYLIFTHRNPHCDDWPVIYNVAVKRYLVFNEVSPVILSPRKENYYCHICKDFHKITTYTTPLQTLPGICGLCGRENLKWSIDSIIFSDIDIGRWQWQTRCGKCMSTSVIYLTYIGGNIGGVNGEKSPLSRIKYIIANTSVGKVDTILLDV